MCPGNLKIYETIKLEKQDHGHQPLMCAKYQPFSALPGIPLELRLCPHEVIFVGVQLAPNDPEAIHRMRPTLIHVHTSQWGSVSARAGCCPQRRLNGPDAQLPICCRASFGLSVIHRCMELSVSFTVSHPYIEQSH